MLRLGEPVSSSSLQFGAYSNLEEVGRGNVGVVYRAWEAQRGRFVALKVLQDPLAPGRRERFVREARYFAYLANDPGAGVPFAFGVGTEGDRPYYTREFVEGCTFETWLTGDAADPIKGVRILQRVAEVVSRIHRLGVLHRGLRPENVLITSNDKPMLIGLGMARAFDISEPPEVGWFEIDLMALQEMLQWFVETVKQPCPENVLVLARSAVPKTAADFAQALASCLPETPIRKAWWRFW